MLVSIFHSLKLSENDAIILTTINTIIALVFMSIEYLNLLKKSRLNSNTLFSWEILSSRAGWLYTGWRGAFFKFIFEDRRFGIVILLRLLVAVFLLFNVENRLFVSFCLFILFFISCLINIRHFHGRDGADEVLAILLIGLGVYYAININFQIRWIGPAFVIAQLTLSYFISGIYKLKSNTWRSGKAVQKIMATEIYGKPSLVFLFRKKSVALICCWVVIVWETTFPLIFLIPSPFCFIWLILGMMFHISMSYIMGLNTFMFSYLSAYPLFFFQLTKPHFII